MTRKLLSDGIYLEQEQGASLTVLVFSQDGVTAIEVPNETSASRKTINLTNTFSSASKLKMRKINLSSNAVTEPAFFKSDVYEKNTLSHSKFWNSDGFSKINDSFLTPTVLTDSSGRIFRCLPYRGGKAGMAVCIEPELIFICGEDLSPNFPPSIEKGRCREMLTLFKQIKALEPKVIIPASGSALHNEDAILALDLAINYLESLQNQVMARISTHFPVEQLMYSLHWSCCWHQSCSANEDLIERHRQNISNVASDYVRV